TRDTVVGGSDPAEGARAAVLSRLAATLEAFPSLRVGQLLLNVLVPPADLYYVTDAELAAALDAYTREWSDRE
ncbi:MAG TPA: hypothetical protein VK573_02760, partial [Gemmatimonadales bacterium]|nr:hypothetical protein [Gemmatimonadales bacterium]